MLSYKFQKYFAVVCLEIETIRRIGTYQETKIEKPYSSIRLIASVRRQTSTKYF